MRQTRKGGRPVRIRGVVRLPGAVALEDATVIVGLDDVTLIDAPSIRLAEVVIHHVQGQRSEIPFDLKTTMHPRAQASYVISAEVRRRPTDRVQAGDYLSTAHCPWSPGDTAEKIVPVEKV